MRCLCPLKFAFNLPPLTPYNNSDERLSGCADLLRREGAELLQQRLVALALAREEPQAGAVRAGTCSVGSSGSRPSHSASQAAL